MIGRLWNLLAFEWVWHTPSSISLRTLEQHALRYHYGP